MESRKRRAYQESQATPSEKLLEGRLALPLQSS